MFPIKRAIILFVFFTSCLSADSREEKILKYSADKNKADKYAIYLINPDNYTSKGAEFHAKYYQYLIGIARSVAEEKKLSVLEKSIGFYYDKIEDRKDKLYLGIDVVVPVEADLTADYQNIALSQFRKHLSDLLYILQSCTGIFKEKEVVGSVIGIRWEREGIREIVTIWINKNDVINYEKKELTFNEVIQRNFVTNTEGKIIRLLR